MRELQRHWYHELRREPRWPLPPFRFTLTNPIAWKQIFLYHRYLSSTNKYSPREIIGHLASSRPEPVLCSLQQAAQIAGHTYAISGSLNGVITEIYPDTGSGMNTITREFAQRRGYHVYKDARYRTTFRDAAGFKRRTKGIVRATWTFEDNPGKRFSIIFHVLTACPHPVMFGDPFLQAEHIMTYNSHRIKKVLIKGASALTACSINLLHGSSRLMLGRVGNVDVTALPDSGSRLNIMSLAFAKRNNFSIATGSERLDVLTLANNHRKSTVGHVTLPWTFSGYSSVHNIIFDVLDGASHDVILGQDIVYGLQAYQKFSLSLIIMVRKPAILMDRDVSDPILIHPFLKTIYRRRRRKGINYVGRHGRLHLKIRKMKDKGKDEGKAELKAVSDSFKVEAKRRAKAEYEIGKIADEAEKEEALRLERQMQVDWGSRITRPESPKAESSTESAEGSASSKSSASNVSTTANAAGKAKRSRFKLWGRV